MKTILQKHKELNTIQETLQALLDGYILRDKVGNHFYKLSDIKNKLVLASTYYTDIDWINNDRINIQTICDNCDLIAYEEVEYTWYNNIGPEGVLCWVTDESIELIIKMNPDPNTKYPFVGLHSSYSQATPLTKDEALIRIV